VTASALYEGTVRHRRTAEREHAFAYRLSMAYLDLDELPRLLGGRLMRARPGLVRFRRADYLGRPDVPLGDAVRAAAAEHLGEPAPDGPIRVLTHLRTFGHCFNPVSFYYLFDRDERLRALLAEVTNTPWGERQTYAVRAGDAPVLHGDTDKRMHVSPFMGMDQRYEWSAAEPGRTLSVHIASRERGERVFEATLGLERTPLTRRSLARATVRHPAATLRLLALIYGHALALRLKGVRVRPHPGAQTS
jgi:uncharacterized protein